MFAKDLYRGVDVTLDGVGKLSKDLNTALDQIAHFVTGNADAKFDTLDVASKKKAAIVIGTIGQDSEKAIVNGGGYALDPKGDEPAVSFVGDQSNDKKVYRLSLGQGVLNVRMSHTEHRTSVLVKGEHMEVPKGITLEAGFRYTISEEEMNRLTTLDLAAYNDTEVLAEFNMVGENRIYENHVDKMYDKIPQQYRIKAQCTTRFEVEVRD